MPSENSPERAIGRLEGKVDLMLANQTTQHASNDKKWDEALRSMHLVAEHDEWIDKEGRPAVESVNASKSARNGFMIGISLGSGAIGALIIKIAYIIGPISH